MSFFLGIDLGTSYFKAGIFDETGQLKGLGRKPVSKKNEDGIICELEVEVFWETLGFCVSEAMLQAGVSHNEILTLSYSSQANSFILLDKDNAPLTPIILWPDIRVEQLSDSFLSVIQKSDFHQITGIGIQPGVTSMVAKIGWFKDNQPEIWGKVKSIMSIADYFTFMLTGKKIIDCSIASMTGLFDVTQRKWWTEAFDVMGLKQRYFSSTANSGSRIGSLTDKGAKLLGLSTKVQFFLGALDHHMVAIGAGLQYHDFVSESTGTVLACVNYKNEYLPQKEMNVAPGLQDNTFFQMAFNTNGALALEWYQQNYASELTIVELLELAGKVDIGADGLFASQNANKYPDLSGFNGAKECHSKAHYIRAVLESTGLSLQKLISDLDKLHLSQAVVSSGGGARSHLWIRIKAEMLNKTFLIPECSELACQGAAMLGFMGVSSSRDIKEIIQTWVRFKDTIHANPANVEKYRYWSNSLKIK